MASALATTSFKGSPDQVDVKQPGNPTSLRLIYVDISTIVRSDAGTGIQRVVRGLLSAIQATASPSTEIVPVAASERCGYRRVPQSALEGQRGSHGIADWPVIAPRKGDVFFGLDLTASVMPRHERTLRSWRLAGVRIAIVVYDLLPVVEPRFFMHRTRRNYRRWLGVVRRQADEVLCISNEVARTFSSWHSQRRLFWRRPRDIHVSTIRMSGTIAQSRPSSGLPDNCEEILAWLSRAPTVLMLGTIEPRKGYDGALAAFDLLWRRPDAQPLQLLVVGRAGWNTKRLQHRLRARSDLAGSLLWLDTVSDEFLDVLFKNVHGLLFTSHAEGFGLPLLEAMRYDKPVLARNLPVFREAVGNAAAYFDDDGPVSLAEAISRWMSGHLTSVSVGLDHAWDWNESARDVLRRLLLHDEVRSPTAGA